jgi:UDP-glucose 4-epimerase
LVKKVFITGVAGLLGSNLAKRLISTGNYEVIGVDNGIGGIDSNVPSEVLYHKLDILDTEELKNLMKGVDTVFHAAALPYEGLSVFSPTITATSIVSGTLSVAIAAIQNNVRLFINCSSMARYGDQQPPFTEDMPTKPVDPYGLAKVQAEQHLDMLSQIHGLNYVTVVPHNVIGVGQRYFDPFRNVVGIMINRTLQGKPIIVYGDGSQERSFSNVEDCVIAIERLITTDRDIYGKVYNIGPDHNEMTILELAKLVAKTCNTVESVTFYKGRPREVKYAYCSSDRIRKDFNYNAKIPIETTIKQMVEWIKPIVRDFEYHLPIELVNDKTPKTWTDRLI